MITEIEKLTDEITELLLKHEVENEILALQLAKLVLAHEKTATETIYNEVLELVREELI